MEETVGTIVSVGTGSKPFVYQRDLDDQIKQTIRNKILAKLQEALDLNGDDAGFLDSLLSHFTEKLAQNKKVKQFLHEADVIGDVLMSVQNMIDQSTATSSYHRLFSMLKPANVQYYRLSPSLMESSRNGMDDASEEAIENFLQDAENFIKQFGYKIKDAAIKVLQNK